MRSPKLLLLVFFYAILWDTKPATAQDSAAIKGEQLLLQVDTIHNMLTPSTITAQKGVSFDERGDGKAAFFIPIVLGYAITKGVQEVQTLITDHKNKFTASYPFAQRDHYFYDQISTTGAFDPVGMQFKGFTILRLVKHKTPHNKVTADDDPADHGHAHHGIRDSAAMDTVFMAKFIVDTTENKCTEMASTGIFRLRLDSLKITSGRVKLPHHYKRLNMDFEIDFTATYRGDNGQLFLDAPMGKFVYPLRNAPVYGKDSAAPHFYDSIDRKKPALTGECFMIPRSVGYHKNEHGILESCWGQGLYAVSVTVKETAKEKYIDKLIVFSADPAYNIGTSILQNQVGGTSTKTKK
jgi:hypothetical protein